MTARGLAIVALLALTAPAAAEPVTLGVFAPSTPFEGTAAHLEFATKLAVHLAGPDAVGRVYGKASDFTAALGKGEIQLAVVDAAFLASSGVAHTDLAVAVRGDDTAVAWQLVAKEPIGSVLDLEGRTVIVPVTDGHHLDFVANAMLGGELPVGFFTVDASPDVVSAVAAVSLGKADAAVVPSGVALPGGVNRIAALPSVSWPILFAAKGAPADVIAQARARAASFGGSGAIAGFRLGGTDGYRGLARRMKRALRQTPMLLPNLRIAVGSLIEGRTFAITRPSAASYLPR